MHEMIFTPIQTVLIVVSLIQLVILVALVTRPRSLGAGFTRQEAQRISVRLSGLESRIGEVPQRAEFVVMTDRVTEMEKTVAVVLTDVRSTREGVQRIEHNLHMLMEHAIKGPHR